MIDRAGAPAIPFLLRSPNQRDGAAVYELIRAAGGLDLNSRYCYLLCCTHFASTCVVAQDGERLSGFLSAYRKPGRPEVLFVWQVAVAPERRGRGVASSMLEHLIARPACEGVRFVEATVSPGNAASRALFRSLSRRLGAPWVDEPGFLAAAFLPDPHEPEPLVRIGPILDRSLERRMP